MDCKREFIVIQIEVTPSCQMKKMDYTSVVLEGK